MGKVEGIGFVLIIGVLMGSFYPENRLLIASICSIGAFLVMQSENE